MNPADALPPGHRERLVRLRDELAVEIETVRAEAAAQGGWTRPLFQRRFNAEMDLGILEGLLLASP